ncbi:hypothetical protein ACFY0P_14375 [Streptomyces sp. NPDC001714]|uniref:hypothetical protein n=1 Tax=Streptomyces sp. NPDC001714 TaxID=3364603 RepID=UPI0036966AEC
MTSGQSEHHPRAIYELLGQMVSTAAQLELLLQLLARFLVETPYAAHWINGQNSGTLIKLIRDVTKEHPGVSPDRLTELQVTLTECARLFDRRHGYVHGAWSVDASSPDEPGAWQTMRFTRGKQVPTFAPLSLDDLADLIHGLDEVRSKVTTWYMEQIRVGSITVRKAGTIGDESEAATPN